MLKHSCLVFELIHSDTQKRLIRYFTEHNFQTKAISSLTPNAKTTIYLLLPFYTAIFSDGQNFDRYLDTSSPTHIGISSKEDNKSGEGSLPSFKQTCNPTSRS